MLSQSCHESVLEQWTLRPSGVQWGWPSDHPVNWSMLVRQSFTLAASYSTRPPVQEGRHRWLAMNCRRDSTPRESVLAPATVVLVDVRLLRLALLWNVTLNHASQCRRQHGTCSAHRSRRRWVKALLISSFLMQLGADQLVGTVHHRHPLRCMVVATMDYSHSSSSSRRCLCSTRHTHMECLFTSHPHSALYPRLFPHRSLPATWFVVTRWQQWPHPVWEDTRQMAVGQWGSIAVGRRQPIMFRHLGNCCRIRGVDTCWTHSWHLVAVWRHSSRQGGRAETRSPEWLLEHPSRLPPLLGPRHSAEARTSTSACSCSFLPPNHILPADCSNCLRLNGDSLVPCSSSSSSLRCFPRQCPSCPRRPSPRPKSPADPALQCSSSCWRPAARDLNHSASTRGLSPTSTPVTQHFPKTLIWTCLTLSPRRTLTVTLSRSLATSCHSETSSTSVLTSFISTSLTLTLAPDFVKTSSLEQPPVFDSWQFFLLCCAVIGEVGSNMMPEHFVLWWVVFTSHYPHRVTTCLDLEMPGNWPKVGELLALLREIVKFTFGTLLHQVA